MRIAIVTPCILPVPNVAGGAVEGLITNFILQNEANPRHELEVYTIANEELKEYEFKHTKLISISSSKADQMRDRLMDKLARSLSISGFRRSIDKKIGKLLKIRGTNYYNLVLVENLTSLYEVVKEALPETRIVFHIHNNPDIYRTEAGFHAMAQDGTRILCASQFLKQQVLAIEPKAECQVLLNGVNLERFQTSTSEKSPKSTMPDKFTFLYAGRLIEEKGVLELLEACLLLNQRVGVNQYRLLLTGKSLFERSKATAYEKGLQELAKKLPNVEFTGFVVPKDMPKIYDKADCLVVPSLFEEPFGMVALEGAAMSLPLILNQRGGLTEIVGMEYPYLIPVDKWKLNEKGFENPKEQREYSETLSRCMEAMLRLSENNRRDLGRQLRSRIENDAQLKESTYYERFCQLIS